ncbi:AraC family transcriptional regulator [Desulfosporosinus sp. FKB]|uniref:helix-turn-helix domain-containing protein n=1 Tax=Desulfosporosinus sp. FKB TaxID=1969835 RepID=UPI000B49A6EE|nr:AraC family transcriptional regulator [Desulfosporosinus sp. FKB]
MVNEIRNICYDTNLNIEAYQFKGIMQKFPNHFHDYYVLGFIESGKRYLTCNNQNYILNAGNITIFNPQDTHTCIQVDGKALDYRCINIEPNIMRRTVEEITGNGSLPHFKQTVLYHNEIAASLRELNLMIFGEENDFIKEELFLFLLEQLIEDYSDTIPKSFSQESTSEIKTACAYLESNYSKPITLDKLSELTGLSKYHLLRSFTRQKGISPYSYLVTIRINNAKKLLEQGMSPLDVAFQTGFSDQSHFSNFFKKLIGLTPKQYLKIFQNNPKPLLSMGEEI